MESLPGLHFTLSMAASLQGVLLSVVLFRKKTQLIKANILLGFLVLLFSVNLVIPEIAQVYYQQFPHLIMSSDALLLVFGPLLYMYTLFSTGRIKVLHGRDLLHLFPFAIYLCLWLPFLLSSGQYKLDYINSTQGWPKEWLIGWMVACIHIAIYMMASLKVIWQYHKRIKDNFSNLEKINLKWLFSLFTGIAIVWLLDGALLIVIASGITESVPTVIGHLIHYISAILIYYLAYRSLVQSTADLWSNPPLNEAKSVVQKKYHRSGLNDAKTSDYLKELLGCMLEKKPYTNPNLTLSELSDLIAISPNHLSQIINGHLNQNFFDFVNRYRVEETKKLIGQESNSHFTLLALAFEVGFKSKSTFNAAFKKHTGMTPTVYKKRLSNS